VRHTGQSVDRSFRRCGLLGLVTAVFVALTVAGQRGISVSFEALLCAVAVGVFLALATVARRRHGRDRLVYYHHEIAVLATVAAVTAALGRPVAPHLDATALGLGAFLVCGRIGCARAGCCHGRPARRGLRYGDEHVAAGFPSYLRDTPLVPVQLLESAGAALLVLAGCAAVWRSAAAGVGAEIYVAGYAVLRFGLEELRGDPGRRYRHGLSEAQWTSIVLLGGMLALGSVPARYAAAALAATALAAALARRRARPAALDPGPVRELMRAVIVLEHTPGVRETSAGLRVSAGVTGATRHITLSRPAAPLDEALAARLAVVIALAGRSARADLVRGVSATWHVLLERGP
jgi:prolipoprotein diacylglyceryltransferase